MGTLKAPLWPKIKVKKKDNGDIEIDATEFVQELNDNLRRIFEEASSGWAVTNKTADRTLDCDCDDTAVLGDVLGTLIDDLIGKGILES